MPSHQSLSPSHGDPSANPHTPPVQTISTSSHPPPGRPDPTTTTPVATAATAASTALPPSSLLPSALHNAAQGGQPSTGPPGSSELARLKISLRSGLRQFPDFPSPGVLFEDIMPLFASPTLHVSLVRALQLQLAAAFSPSPHTITTSSPVDVIVGLESRGFLFGPTLALSLGAAFVPVRKKGKLPGSCETESFQKEYGADHFQIQSDAIKSGQRVVIMDDIIATGGSASAAGRLVRKLGGDLVGYVFLMELDFLKGREKLDAPVHTLLSAQETALNNGVPQ